MNQIFESQIGKYFTIAYAGFAIAVYVFVFFCGFTSCSVYIVLPIMPWALILVEDLGLSFPWAIYPIFILLNASVAYVFGATIEWSYNRYLDYKEDKKLEVLNQNESKFHNLQ